VPTFMYRLLSYLAAEAPSATDPVETLRAPPRRGGAEGYRLTGVLPLAAGGLLILEREAEPGFERIPMSDLEP
jgi:hypothetical protein